MFAVLLGFLVPGAGHFYMGKRGLGISFFTCVTTLFILGWRLGGGILWSEMNILTYLAYFVEFSNGVPFLVLVGAKAVCHQPQYFSEIGATLMLVSGSLNLLILVQLGDLSKAEGQKS